MANGKELVLVSPGNRTRVRTGRTVAPSERRTATASDTGSARNWTDGHFDQANWYAFGRLAWDPSLSSEQIAREWAAQTFSRDAAFLAAVVPMMLQSHQAVVDYMTPLGLHHLMGRGHHYGPGPWVEGGPRADWTSVYYHRADANGIGFDRTKTGSNAIAQYAPQVAARFGSRRVACPAERGIAALMPPWCAGD